MAKFVGNQGGSDSYPTTKSPSTHDRDAVEGGFTSSFPKDRVTHSHMTPKGEAPYEREYRSKDDVGKHSRGPALNRAVKRGFAHDDDAQRFGTIGSGAVYGGTPDKAGKWDIHGKSTERSGSENFGERSSSDILGKRGASG